MSAGSRHPARRRRSGTLDAAVASARAVAKPQGARARTGFVIAVGTRSGPVDLTDARPRDARGVGLDQAEIAAIHAHADAAADRRGEPHMRSIGSGGVALLAGITPLTLLDTLDLVAADPKLVCATWLREPSQPQFVALRAIERARLEPNGLHPVLIPNDGNPETAQAVAAILTLHMTVARARTPSQRRALAAVAEHGTVTAAAAALGCRHQAVSQALLRANARATDATIVALNAVLADR